MLRGRDSEIRSILFKGGGQSAWAIVDQGLFGISNFVLNLLLARWIPPQEFGAFTIGFTIFLLVGCIYAGSFLEPMLVFAKSRYQDCLGKYFGTLLYAHWIFSGLMSVLFLGFGLAVWSFGMVSLGYSLGGVGIAGPFMLYLLLTRRFCYVRVGSHFAAYSSALYLVIVVTGISVLSVRGQLAIFSAFIVMGVASLMSSLLLLHFFNLEKRSLEFNALDKRVWESHRRYGGWAISTNVLTWVPGNIYFLFLPVVSGLEASAALKALLNLIMPIQQAFSSVGVVLLPIFAREKIRSDYQRIIRLILVFLTSVAALYWCLLYVFRRPLMIWFYGGLYDTYGELLWILGLIPIFSGAVTVFGAALRAAERPERVFWVYAFSSFFAIGFGLVAISFLGVLGAVWALVLSYIVTGCLLWASHTFFLASSSLQKA